MVYTELERDFNQATVTPSGESFQFQVKACMDLHIFLTQNPGSVEAYAYQIVLGSDDNQKSSIRKKEPYQHTETFDTPNVLNCESYLDFWLSWTSNIIEMGTGVTTGNNMLFSWRDVSNPYPINVLSLASRHSGQVVWQFLRESGEETKLHSFLFN